MEKVIYKVGQKVMLRAWDVCPESPATILEIFPNGTMEVLEDSMNGDVEESITVDNDLNFLMMF
jgi:hypothetical protein